MGNTPPINMMLAAVGTLPETSGSQVCKPKTAMRIKKDKPSSQITPVGNACPAKRSDKVTKSKVQGLPASCTSQRTPTHIKTEEETELMTKRVAEATPPRVLPRPMMKKKGTRVTSQKAINRTKSQEETTPNIPASMQRRLTI